MISPDAGTAREDAKPNHPPTAHRDPGPGGVIIHPAHQRSPAEVKQMTSQPVPDGDAGTAGGGGPRPNPLSRFAEALALYDAYHEKASACDVRIEAVLKELSIHRGRGHGSVPPPRRRHRTDQANALAFDVRAALFALLGRDIKASGGTATS